MYYRGESRDYGSTACVPSIFRIPGYSILFEQEYFEKLLEDFSGIAIFDSVKRDATKYEYYYLKILGVFQHYGYSTRLLDISTNKKIATYFASSKDFNESGRVYLFDENLLKEIHTPSAESILRKIKCIRYANRYANRNVLQELDIPKRAKYTITNNLIVDYRMVLKDVIGTTNDNLRLNQQSGAFVLFGHHLDAEGRLTGVHDPLDISAFEEVVAGDKFNNLIDLAFGEDNICYVTVYPDSERSMDIVARYRYLSILKEDNEDVFRSEFNKRIDELEYAAEVAHRLKEDAIRIVGCSTLFYFINVEFRDFCKEIEEESDALCAYERLLDSAKEWFS